MPITFWIIIAIMAAVATALLVMPLLGTRLAGAARGAHALQVYRQQLKELQTDEARGILPADPAHAARLEIQRRILAIADDGATISGPPSIRSSRLLAVGLAILAPALAVTMYFQLGSPSLTPEATVQQVRGADKEHLDMAALTQQLAARLEKSSGDLQGWMLLGRSYLNLGDTANAVIAYRKAVALAGDKPAPMVLAEFAEALVYSRDGQVDDEAAATFRRVLQIMPSEPRAKFFLAMQRAQKGDPTGALQDWVALIKSAPPDAPWLPAVREQAQETATQLNLDLAGMLPDQPPVPESQGPSTEDMQAAAQLPEGDRKAMIENMVAGLAERLNTQEPDNVDGWLKLGRAYGVLGRPVDQLMAFRRASDAGPKRPDALTAYADALDAAGESQHAGKVWRQLLAHLAPGSPEHAAITSKLKAQKLP